MNNSAHNTTHKTHWRKFIETNYLGGFDLADGKGGFREITATISRVQKETVKNQQGKDEDVLTLHFDGLKPMILNVTNSKTMAKLTGSAYVEDWVGRSIIIGTEKSQGVRRHARCAPNQKPAAGLDRVGRQVCRLQG